VCPWGDYKLAAYNYDQCIWCVDEIERKKDFFSEEPNSYHQYLKTKDYKYLLFETYCLKEFTTPLELQSKVNQLIDSGLFQLHKDFRGVVLLTIK